MDPSAIYCINFLSSELHHLFYKDSSDYLFYLHACLPSERVTLMGILLILVTLPQIKLFKALFHRICLDIHYIFCINYFYLNLLSQFIFTSSSCFNSNSDHCSLYCYKFHNNKDLFDSSPFLFPIIFDLTVQPLDLNSKF